MANEHFRQRIDGEEQRTTSFELFFDLVFVFAITQTSTYLFHHLDFEGAARSLMLLLVVWWAWIYTAWTTNWFDPSHQTVRLMLIVVMLASLGMAIALPEAFDDRAPMFAISYVAMMVIRNAFMTISAHRNDEWHRAFAQILIWLAVAGVFWIVGSFCDDPWRTTLWLIALGIDYLAPLVFYWIPRWHHASFADLPIDGGHFAERCHLFVIIALGESIVITGTTAVTQDIDLLLSVAIAVTFLTAASLWWLYFDYLADVSQRNLAAAESTTDAARDAFTYLHIPIVAGIVVTAVGAEEILVHPGDQLTTNAIVAVCAGPVLYLLGHVAFRLRMVGTWNKRRLSGAIAIVLVGIGGSSLPATALGALVLFVLLTIMYLERGNRQWLVEHGMLSR